MHRSGASEQEIVSGLSERRQERQEYMAGRGREKGIGGTEAPRHPLITKYLAAKKEPTMSVEAGAASQRAVRATQRQLAAMEESAISATSSRSAGNIRTELTEALEVSSPIMPWTRATTEAQVCSLNTGETIVVAGGKDRTLGSSYRRYRPKRTYKS